ncbi:alpha/beta hydrolase [Ideonella sp.]|uniref:alpha/beta hydrolase n=1 Tax=Ideonella sp. TaxID=1929293 RepID=UPI0035AFA8CE
MPTPLPPPRRRGWKRWLAALLGGAGASAQVAAAAPAAAPPAPAPSPAAPAAAARPVDPALAHADVLLYKTVGAQRLRLQVARPAAARFPGPRPCVVFFHGGAWRNGDPKQFMAYARALAEHGVIGISAQYRLMSESEVLPVPAVQDARSALRFVKSRAAQIGCDPQRIAAGGGSSGGHLALMTAVPVPRNSPVGPLDDPSDDLGVSPRPQALFVMNAPLNLERYDRPVPVEQRRAMSPTLLMDASLPPTWIFHGTADKVVPFAQAGEFRDRARQLGAGEVTVQAFPGRGHGFFNAKRREGEDFDTTLAGMLAGLKKLGWL